MRFLLGFFRHPSSWYLLAVFAVAVAAFTPAIFHGEVITHGDSLIVGLALMQRHIDVLHGHASLLWAPGVYGGHALHAEGQGAFLHPLTLLVDALLPLFSAQVVLHLLCILLAALGSYKLCRALGLQAAASAFAALLVPFCDSWLFNHDNLPVSLSLAFTPWLLWAYERWWASPNLRRGLTLSTCAALVVLGGYPQVAHGMAIYLLLLSGSRLFLPEQFRYFLAHRSPLLIGGAFAAVLAIALCAAQLLPLAELVPNSHRTGGIGLLFPAPSRWYYAGLLLPTKLTVPLGSPIVYCSSLGSLVATPLLCAALAWRMPSRVLGHALCALFLFVLGMGNATPLYALMMETHLIPGLAYFRISAAYTMISIIAMAVTAAFAVNALSTTKNAALLFGTSSRERLVRALVFMILLLLWLRVYLVSIAPNDPSNSLWAFPALLLICIAGCIKFRRNPWTGPLALVLLMVELCTYRIAAFHDIFSPRAALGKSVAATIIERDPDYRVYRHVDTTFTSAVAGLAAANDPQRLKKLRDSIDSLSGTSSLLWGIPSLDGYLALESNRADLTRKAFLDEVDSATAPNGQRLLDELSARYISAYHKNWPHDLTPFWNDPQRDFALLRNQNVLPPIRLYGDYRAVSSPQQALADLHASDHDFLAVENLPANSAPQIRGSCSGALSIQRHDDTHLRVTSDNSGDCWLFVADAPYPSWKAWVNNQPTSIYPAQVMGRAIHLPPGHNVVEMRFVSTSFRVGAIISLLALLTLIALFAWSCHKRETHLTS